MNLKKLSALQMATDAMYQKQHQALRPVIEAEALVQKQLVRLDHQVTLARQDSAGTEGYRVSGADILWNAWESATRRQLNMELARVRAQKLAAMEQLRTAFGRQQAIASVSKTMRDAQQKAKDKTRSNL